MSNQSIVFLGKPRQPGAFLRPANSRILFASIACCSAPLLNGCGDDEIRAYRAPKAPVQQQAALPTPVVNSSSREVIWTIPEGWAEVPTEQAMRIATFQAGDAGVEVTLSAFPGSAGGVLANVNRWRGQIGLEQTNEAGLLESIVSIPEEDTGALVLDLRGPDDVRMLGAIVSPGDGQSWFVKATSDTASLEPLLGSFSEFSNSIRLGEAPAAADPHAGHNHPPGMHGVANSVNARLGAWVLPTNWEPEEGASPILSASYLASNDSGGARITVTSLVGDGGGALANINRWRGQLGLGPMDQLDASIGVVRESPLTVDLTAPDDSSRMLATIVEGTGETFYFKMTGSVEGCEAELGSYDRLVLEVGGATP